MGDLGCTPLVTHADVTALPACATLHIPAGFSRWLPLRRVLADILERGAGPVALFVRKAHWPLLTSWFAACSPLQGENTLPQRPPTQVVTIISPLETCAHVPLSRTSIHLLDCNTKGARSPVDMHTFGTVVADIGRDRLTDTALHVLRGRLLERRVVILTTASIMRGISRCALEETDGWGFAHRVCSATPLEYQVIPHDLHTHESPAPLVAEARARYFGTLLESLEASAAPVAYRQETLAWCIRNADHDDDMLPVIARANAVWRSMSYAARESRTSPMEPDLLASFCAEVHAVALCRCLSFEKLGEDIQTMVQAWAERKRAHRRPGTQRLCQRAIVLAPHGKQAQVARILAATGNKWVVESHTFQHGLCRGFNSWRRYTASADACLHLLLHLRSGARDAVGERVYAEGVLAQELFSFLQETRIFVLDVDAAAEMADALSEARADALFLPWPTGAWGSTVNTAIHVPWRGGTLESALLATSTRKRKLR